MEAYAVDWHRSPDDGPRPARYRLAFLLAAAAMGIGGAYLLLVFASLQVANPDFRRFVDDPRWDHFLGGPLAIADLLAALLLTGCRPERSWRVRSVLLVTASAVGLGLWCVEHSHFFDWAERAQAGGDDPLTILCLRSVALIRVVALAGMAALAADVQRRGDGATLRDGAIGAAFLAFLVWLALAITHIDLGQLPPRWRDIHDPMSFQLLASSILLRGLSYGLLRRCSAPARSRCCVAEETRQKCREVFSQGERPNIA